MKNINTIIFDLGGVLIDWNPEYVYLKEFNDDRKKMQWFFDNICTVAWNENQDAGYPMQQATEDRVALFPEYETLIRMYYGRWVEMLGDAKQGTVDILKTLTENPKYKVVALTNWSHETFPIALERFDFLQWFEGIVVSGEEKTRKPFADIYEITLKRFNITSENAIFIDDNLQNVKASESLGINGIHFETPIRLKEQLKAFNIHIIMITIYHNPRCQKSREGLQLLEISGKGFNIIKYLDNPLTKKELTDVISKLDITPIDLVRTNEAIWKTDYKGKTLSNSDVIEAMLRHPKLIERPIVVNKDKAVIGRPKENISTII